VATTIGQANIQLTASADEFGADMAKIQKQFQNRLGKMQEVGEKFTNSIQRAGALGNTFTKLSTDVDKLGASFDATVGSLQTLVGTIALAKSTGSSFLAAAALGVTALGAAAAFSLLEAGRTAGSSRPAELPLGTHAPPSRGAWYSAIGRTFLPSSGASLDRDLGGILGGDGSRAPRAPDWAIISDRAADRAADMARGLEDSLDAVRGMTREDIGFRAIERSLDRIPSATAEWAAATESLARARAVAGRLDAERRAAEGRAFDDSERRRGEAMFLAVNPREAARRELTDMMRLSALGRLPGGEDTLRAHAARLARGLGGDSPFGVAGELAGSSGAISAINARSAGGATAVELLAEVRDAIRDDAARGEEALRAIGDRLTPLIDGIGRFLRSVRP
jgi:hypothetical protein